MPKFHVNPETGNPNRCYAVKQCRFGEDSDHYESKALAAKAYEQQETSSVIVSHKASSIGPVSYPVTSLNGTSSSNGAASEQNVIVDPVKLDPVKSGYVKPVSSTMTEEQLAEYDKKFKNLRESSYRVMKVFKNTVVIDNNYSSTIAGHKDGRAMVTLAEHPVDYLNGDYIAGDLTQDPELFVSLLKNDPELEFINGDCADLAYDLYDAYPEHVASVSQIWVKGDVNSMHSIAQLKDGSFIDGLGHWSPSGVVSAWAGMMDKDMEMRTPDSKQLRSRARKEPLFESTKIIGQYLDKVYSLFI